MLLSKHVICELGFIFSLSLTHFISFYVLLRRLGFSVWCWWVWCEKASLPHFSFFVGTCSGFLPLSWITVSMREISKLQRFGSPRWLGFFFYLNQSWRSVRFFFQILFLYQLTQELYPDDIYFLIYVSSESPLPMEFKSFCSIIGLGYLFICFVNEFCAGDRAAFSFLVVLLIWLFQEYKVHCHSRMLYPSIYWRRS